MSQVLWSKENDCRSCYKCIRGCPTKSIAFHHGQASIIQEECVLCGRCYEICPSGCKTIRDDKKKILDALERKEEVLVSLAPSFFSSFEGVSFESMKEALLALGFSLVEETAIGATEVKKAYDALLENTSKDILISTACHSVNLLFEKHYPELLSYLCPVVSPMVAHAQSLKERYPNAKIVFIGPCIAKKDEVDVYSDLLFSSLTFLDLKDIFEAKGIVPKKEDFPSSTPKSLARLFPLSGGILETMEKKNRHMDYLYVDGMDRCLEIINEIKEGKIHHAFIEMSACEGSCVGGPASKKGPMSLYSGSLRIRKMAGKYDFDTPRRELSDLSASFASKKKAAHHFSDEEIAKVLRSIGKTSKKEELNCACCGYPTCVEKAKAVLEGKASLEMCLPYLMKKAQSFSNTIVESMDSAVLVLNEDLRIELLNPAASKLFDLPKEVLLNRPIEGLMDTECFGLALGGSLIRHHKLTLNNEKIVEASLHYDPEYHILIALLNDVTKEEKARARKEEMLEKTAKITDQVIDKNMRAVQEIASLLGETTAETKIALTRLRDVLDEGKDETK